MEALRAECLKMALTIVIINGNIDDPDYVVRVAAKLYDFVANGPASKQ